MQSSFAITPCSLFCFCRLRLIAGRYLIFKNPKPFSSCYIGHKDHIPLSLWLKLMYAWNRLKRLASHTAFSLLWYFLKWGSLASVYCRGDSFWGLWTKWLLFPTCINPLRLLSCDIDLEHAMMWLHFYDHIRNLIDILKIVIFIWENKSKAKGRQRLRLLWKVQMYKQKLNWSIILWPTQPWYVLNTSSSLLI